MEILRNICVINNIEEYQKTIGQEFKLREIDEKNYFIEEMTQNEFISKRHRNICKILNYTEHWFMLASTVTRFVSISVFASLIGMPVVIKSSAATIKFFVITADIKKYKSIIKK